MRERPILFSGPMVRAILDGKKTQTRRTVKPQPDLRDGWTFAKRERDGCAVRINEHGRAYDPQEDARRFRCPYAVGDMLWVRETWAAPSWEGAFSAVAQRPDRILYRADDGTDADLPETRGFAWRPSIHMPRWASRLTLEVVSVRVERLNDISEADAQAEVVQSDTEALSALSHLRGADAARAVPSRLRTARDNFRGLWDEINGDRAPWKSNPWVWAVEFRRAAAPAPQEPA